MPRRGIHTKKIGLGSVLIKQKQKSARKHLENNKNAIEDHQRIVPREETTEDYNKQEQKILDAQELTSKIQTTELEELFDRATLMGKEYEGEKANAVVLSRTAVPQQWRQSDDQSHELRESLLEEYPCVCVPRRPPWEYGITKDELIHAEEESFLYWRRQLAEFENQELMTLTPFEKNLQVWRQLWRVIERSELIVQIIDARDPLFFYSPDLTSYISEVHRTGKFGISRSLILLNKADMLSDYQRQQWALYLSQHLPDLPFIFFSAITEDQDGGCSSEALETHISSEHIFNPIELHELFVHVIMKNRYRGDGNNGNNSNETGKFPAVVGMVGFPNVGKSSTINKLCGSKKVAVTSNPGKTKHFQTILLSEKICMCDCPGLVFPNIGVSKAHMITNGLLSIDRMRDYVSPMSLVCSQFKRELLNNYYRIVIDPPLDHEDPKRPCTPEELLSAFAFARGYLMRNNVPDRAKAARFILKDYVNGRLIFAHPPPGLALADIEKFLENSIVNSLYGGNELAFSKPEFNRIAKDKEEEKYQSQSSSLGLISGKHHLGKEYIRTKFFHSPIPINDLKRIRQHQENKNS